MVGRVFGVLTSAFVLSAYGAASAQECTDIARVLARESEKLGNSSQIQMQNKAHLCSSRYESASKDQKAQIEAAYSLFSGGASANSTQIQQLQEQQCQNQFGSFWSSQVSSSELQRVSSVGADVVRSCLESKGFRIVDLKINNEAVSAVFRYGGLNDTIINGVIISPPDSANCSVLYGGSKENDISKVSGKRVSANSAISLVCDRLPDKSTSGVDQKHYRGGIIGISTTSDTAQVPLIDYAVPPLSQPMAETIRSEIEDIKNKLNNINSKNSDQDLALSSVSDQTFYQCPDNNGKGGGSLGGGAWGYYGCQGQITTQQSCIVIEHPNNKSYQCNPIGKLRVSK
ncbi:hypothetical protein [Azospirillum sp. TSH58]|uniref:hypothetical protein n=1 Tax=Azospirillum sp. TSH58 TaxID=664962 RepID=UPI0011B283EA|nr:hypothetical protein [Azospirillum sp. TSH58]